MGIKFDIVGLDQKKEKEKKIPTNIQLFGLVAHYQAKLFQYLQISWVR